jgi:digeranylgeranylglycerophospholipid reductase
LGMESRVILNTRFVGIEKQGKGYLVETDKGEYYADVVVGADGANSSVRRIGGFAEDIKYFRGVQFRMRHDKCRNNIVQVYLRKPFFAWVIPERPGIVRAGMISDNPYQDLTNFLKEYRIEGQIIEKFAGVVPLGRCCVQKNNLVLVGDAACQVKPISHGGIYYGMRCAEILAECILRNRLGNYEKQWQKKFSHEIDIGLKMRKLYAGLSDEGLTQIFSLLKKHKEFLEEVGDFENHSKVVYALVKDSRFRKLVGDIFFSLAGDLYKIM